MAIGFTGTRTGMTRQQRNLLAVMLDRLYTEEGQRDFHHGDCLGADSQAHDIALELGFKIILHPPSALAQRAFKRGALLTLPAKYYIARNHDIVEASQVLIAAPRTPQEEVRSGTWATVRYARRIGRRVSLLLP